MKYIKTTSSNNLEIFLEFFLEVDEKYLEKRKIELADGNLLGFAGGDIEFNGTTLAKEPLLTLVEINALPNIKAQEIDKEEFEDLWNRVMELALP
ncbi:MAG: hypothetical protein ABI091_08320 [Ferruginibacter sp.]